MAGFKKTLAVAGVGALLAAGFASPATATPQTPPGCEVVTVPAVGEPTIEVPNPDYKEAWTETVNHPAVGEPTITVVDTPEQVIEHDAVTKTQWKYEKLRHRGEVWLDNNDHHRVWINGWEYQRTNKTRTEVIKEAWTETIPATYKDVPNPEYKEAWTETIEHPAVGEPTIVKDNPNYVPESTRVECPEFDWNWQYAAPTCDGFTVTYPAFMPEGNNNLDVNVKVKNLVTGEIATFNFHDSDRIVTGQTITFDVTSHPAWPGWEFYSFVWTQVHSTNYHWEGNVVCGQEPVDPEPEPTDPEPEPTDPVDPEPEPTEPSEPSEPTEPTEPTDPGNEEPGNEEPGSEQPGTEEPGTDGPGDVEPPDGSNDGNGTNGDNEPTDEPTTTNTGDENKQSPKEETKRTPLREQPAPRETTNEHLAETGTNGLLTLFSWSAAALVLAGGATMVASRRRPE